MSAAPQAGAAASRELDLLFKEAAAGAFARERDGRGPFEVIDRFRGSGLGAARVPLEEGGWGLSFRELFEVLIALAAADANAAHILRAHFWFVEECLLFTEEEPRSRWLERVVEGEVFGNARTELGSRPVGGSSFETSLRREADGFRLDGEKYYSTGTLYSDRVVVFAATEDGGTAYAIVPIDREGVTVEDDWDGIGQQLTGTGTTRFVDVAVAPEEVVALPPDFEALPTYQGAFPQLYLTAVVAGVARNVATDAAVLVRGRARTFSHGAAGRAPDDPQLQQIVGELSSGAFAAEATVLVAAEALDRAAASVVGGLPDRSAAAAASLAAAQAKVAVDGLVPPLATRLFDVGGASSVKRDKGLDRHWRNVRTLTSHNPTPYKARAIGDLEINSNPFPANEFF